ncbi:MAG: hypothetical protein Kow0029_16560 [Candidatus Rifleibacteriota bacterium]
MFLYLDRIQTISIICSLFFLIFIIELIRKKKLKEAYALLWLFFSVVFLFFSFWKTGLDYFAAIFGIFYPPALLFLILIVAIILILVQFSVIVSKQNDDIRKLAQELALLKAAKRKKKTNHAKNDGA